MFKGNAGKWFVLAALFGLGCGDRSETWDATFQPTATVGLNSSVAVVDEGLHRVAFLDSPGDLSLRAQFVGVGRDVSTAQPSVDGNRLFLISRGVQPRRDPEDEKPRFMVIDASTATPTVLRQDELEQALSGLALDPQGEWAVIYDGGANGTAFVTNPNELLLISLKDTTSAPVSKTLRSEGGKPQRLNFTRPLQMPDGGQRRFLIVEREHDLALVDLDDASDHREITVGSPENANQRESSPANVVYYEGDELNNAQFAVRFADDTSVGVLELHAPEEGDSLFSLSYNLVDVGGVPSAIAFVRTDGGVRLAAVVPSALAAVLVDTVTSETTVVDLDFAFTGLELVTDALSTKPDSSDVALLYSNSSTAIGFWALGKTSGYPYRSLETNDIGVAVSQVLDVPGDYQHYKLLKSTSGAQFFVLDLNKRQSFPMDGLTALELRVAPDGRRVWAYQPQGTNLARVSLDDLHPVSLSTERPINGVFDIERRDPDARTAVVLHAESGAGLGATVFDALLPDTAHSRFYSGFEFGGLQ